MKHKKTKLMPAHKTEVVTHLTCDICKRSNAHEAKDWCDLSETDVSFRDVEMDYPECGHGTAYSYHICCECFKDKLMPALSALGAEPTEEKYDY